MMGEDCTQVLKTPGIENFIRGNTSMKLYEITFSPTGGTQKAADLLTEALGGERIAVDLTDRTADFSAVPLLRKMWP